MKQLDVICFTKNGENLAARIQQKLSEKYNIQIMSKCSHSRTQTEVERNRVTMAEWIEQGFSHKHSLLFIGAVGIAVRGIAPYLKDKLTDSPVLVMDELGTYVIPILSGHVGGANEIARLLEKDLGARAVITTSTDLNHKFAVDLFAKKRGYVIEPKEGIAKISSKILAGDRVSIWAEKQIEGRFDSAIVITDKEKADIMISPYQMPLQPLLQLIPKVFVIGIGCKKGKTKEEIEVVMMECLKENRIDASAIVCFTSIDIKKAEEGICLLARDYEVPFVTFDKRTLQAVAGEFCGSDFVKSQVGVENVCARSAMAACAEGGHLVADKFAKDGVTIAIAEKKWRVNADE
ncbi:MAG: cobalt-precorrin 5A hydrolase [Velocimicrobium sp.]